MKHSLKLEKVTVIFAIILLMASNSMFIKIPVQISAAAVEYHAVSDTRISKAFEKFEIDKSLDNIKTSIGQQSVRDLNNNKISDYLDSLIEKGYVNLDIIIIYEHGLTDIDIQRLDELGVQIGNIFWQLDMVELHEVQVSNFKTIANLPGVLRLENHGRPILYSDIATPAVKARESDEYSPFTAWELGYSGLGANIAVMDTGVDNAHPSLTGKWVGGVDLSKPEVPVINPYDGSKDADDTNGHGTTCSGIAMGTGAPDKVYMGAAPGAKLVDVRIGTMVGYAPGEGPLSFYDASLKGIHWIIEHHEDSWVGQSNENSGIDILSLSWGIDVGGSSDGSDAYSLALDRAAETGIIVCHAAGNSGPNNDGFDGFAAASNGISVAASDDLNTIERADDIIAEYSSRGPRHDNGDGNLYNELKPDITAPGTHIMQVQYDIIGDGSGNGYGNRGSGTSYATPAMAGICALMLEANPKLTNELIKEILHFTAERRGEPSIPDLDPFWNKDFGWGMVDAFKAVKMASEISNIGAFDVNMQCFINKIEMPDIDDENITSGKITIQGLAFSKSGEVEDIEISIDNGTWKTVSNIKEEGNYLIWEYDLDTMDYRNGNHTINARTLGRSGQSLEDKIEVLILNEPRAESAVTTEQLTILAAVILIVAAAVLIYFHRRRKLEGSK